MRIAGLIICLLCAAMCFAQPVKDLIPLNYTAPSTYTIADITVSGSSHLDEQTIVSLSQLKIGDDITIPGQDISNAIKEIWEERLVGDVSISITKIEGGDIYLNIHLTERPRLSKMVIEGVRKSERTDLKEKFGLIRSQVISRSLRKNIEFQIQKYFEDKGFYSTQVTITDIPDTLLDNHFHLQVDIEKGKKVKIDQLVLNGASKVEEKKLRRKMKKTKQRAWWRVWARSKYIKTDYATDKEALIAYYNSQGMRDAKITKEKIYQTDNPKHINIELTIEEGEIYYFRDITWVGNYIHKDENLQKILGIKSGDVYNQELLDQRLNFNPTGPDISSIYLDNGYLFFSVNPVEVRVENDSIDIEMRIYEGNQATINEVYVNGNTKTSDHVILREIRTLPGQKFSRADLIRTQREIAQLGYFDPETINIIPKPNPVDGTVDIEYRVDEKPSDQLQLSGGWGGAVRFVGTLGLSFNNFSLRNIFNLPSWSPLPSGDGQRFSIRAQSNGPRYQSYQASFTEPWLGGRRPNSFTVSTNVSKISNVASDLSVNGFLKVSTVSLMLGRRLNWPDDYFTLTNSLSYSKYRLENYASFANSLCETCDANNISFNTTLARNNTGDNPQYLTKGANVSLSATFTPPYSLLDRSIENLPEPEVYKWIEYHKWMFDYSRFIQLTGNKRKNQNDLYSSNKGKRHLVLNTRAHIGYIGTYNTKLGVGPFERFSLGGDGLSGFNFLLGTDIIGLRGYDNNSITPTSGGGGRVFNKYVFELRYPLVTEGVATIFILTFLEAGNNWSSPSEFNPFALYRSAGVGARIFMPAFGMIGVDYGRGFDIVPGDPTAHEGQFHFTIGQQIR